MEEGSGGDERRPVWPMNKEFKKTTTATGTGTSLKKMFISLVHLQFIL